MLGTLAWMLIGHAVADYPLQGDWLSMAKNPTLERVPGQTIWPMALLSHASIHAGAVQLVTGMWGLAACEFVAHTLIDYWKSRGGLSYNGDQILHLTCKVLWWGWLVVLSPMGF